jgi:hypothetical protein
LRYSVLDDAGLPLDAHFELDGTTVIFHSRGGAKTGSNARNTEYERGLQLLLDRITKSKIAIADVAVETAQTESLPIEQRSVFSPNEADHAASEIYALITGRMKHVGQQPGAKGGNSTKRLAIRLAGVATGDELLPVLHGAPDRLAASELQKVTAEDLYVAVEQLLSGAPHPFGASIDYDVALDSGERLPPKAVFGLAATRALGYKVSPWHFTAGVGSPCFKALEAAGYKIVAKDEPSAPAPAGLTDAEWEEGTPKMRSHVRRERGSGLAAAKRDEFRRVHGRLFCELCKMDPVKEYGDPIGEACIEVHHATVQVQEMGASHRTKLADLQCLCASCHRVVHRRLSEGEVSR